MTPFLESDALRTYLGPKGQWAKESGDRVKTRRELFKFTQQTLADVAGTTVQSLSKIENGDLVPREYLKASIAYALVCDVAELWIPATRQTLYEKAGSAA